MPVQELEHGGTALVEIVGQLFGQTTVTTFHYRWLADDAMNTILLTTIADEVYNQLNTTFEAVTTEEFSFVACRVSTASSVSGLAAFVKPLSANGDLAAPTLPPSVTTVITRRTGARGSAGRGRVYVPAVPQEWNNSGFISVPAITAYQAFATAMQATITTTLPAGQLVPVIWSRSLIAANDVVSTTVQTILRQQRRREIGVGI